jgi:RNA polymerase sigma-70 factor (ECF subfamily)
MFVCACGGQPTPVANLVFMACHIGRDFGGRHLEAGMTDLNDSAETCRDLEEVRSGDASAFERLFARCQPDLRQFVARRLDPRARTRLDPSDVVQETQLEAYRRMDDYLRRRPMPFRIWLRKTAYERLLKLRRHHVEAARRSVNRELDLPDRSSLLLARPFLDAAASPSRQFARRELARRVRQALAELAESDREVLLMRNVDQLPYREIACMLDVEPAAVRKRYGRALLRLRKLLLDAGLLGDEP